MPPAPRSLLRSRRHFAAGLLAAPMLVFPDNGGMPQTLDDGVPDAADFDAGTVPVLARLLANRPHRPRGGVHDYRPAVHDSDGLLIRNGAGTQIWRPLTIPRELQVSGFQDCAPRGFGLLQRGRRFADYLDLEAAYHRRPSLWVEPLGDWGEGEVQLFEIPTRSEIHDNIVAAWSPRTGLKGGQEQRLAYRLHWGLDDPADARLLRFVLDTSAWQGGLPELAVEVRAGALRHPVVRGNPESGGLRVSFEWHPGHARLGELRARLTRGGTPVSEDWTYRWTA